MMKKWIKRSVALICSLLFVVFASCAYVEKGLNFLFPKDSSYSGSSTQSSLSADDSSSSSENISSSDSNSSSSASSEDSSSSAECTHTYGDWETVVEATCKPGMKERVCTKCGETEQEEISALTDLYAHTFNAQTLCTTCGHQEFIESEEYVEEVQFENGAFYYPGFRWTSVDGTYGLEIVRTSGAVSEFERYSLVGYYGTPVNIVIPSSVYGKEIKEITGGMNAGVRYCFQNCETLKSVIICEGIQYMDNAFKYCTSLERVVFANSVHSPNPGNFVNCTSLKELVIPRDMWCNLYELRNQSSIETIYYYGTQEDQEERGRISGVDDVEDIVIYYYSETQPQEEGNYWHYVGNDPVKW